MNAFASVMWVVSFRRDVFAGASYTPSKPIGTRPIKKMRNATLSLAICGGITSSKPGLPMESS